MGIDSYYSTDKDLQKTLEEILTLNKQEGGEIYARSRW